MPLAPVDSKARKTDLTDLKTGLVQVATRNVSRLQLCHLQNPYIFLEAMRKTSLPHVSKQEHNRNKGSIYRTQGETHVRGRGDAMMSVIGFKIIHNHGAEMRQDWARTR